MSSPIDLRKFASDFLKLRRRQNAYIKFGTETARQKLFESQKSQDELAETIVEENKWVTIPLIDQYREARQEQDTYNHFPAKALKQLHKLEKKVKEVLWEYEQIKQFKIDYPT